MAEFNGKKLLVLGGMQSECDIVKTAQKMGVYVIVADYDRNVPASTIANKFVEISATDIDAIVAFCKEEKIDGITSGFVDILMQPWYKACRKLGMPCYLTPKMLDMSTNKIEFKETCDKYGISVPKTYVIGNSIPKNILREIKYPVFVKPLDASGSKGAGACNNEDELIKKFTEAVGYSVTGQAIVEDYIQGTEFLLDYVGTDGEFRLLSMFDRYMSPGRGTAINYSDICICPSKNINQYYEQINPLILNMFRDLGFTDGLIFLQGYTDGTKITFYEMGCRLGGSFYNLEKAVVGLNPVEMIIRHALTGKMLTDIKEIDSYSADFHRVALVCNYLLKGENETVANISGIETVEKLQSYVALIKRRDIGYVIKKDKIIDKPILSYYMVADDMEQIKKDLAVMNEAIQVTNSGGESLLSEKYNPCKL